MESFSSLVVTLRPPHIVVYGAVSVGQSSDHVLFSVLENVYITLESRFIDKLARLFGRIKAVATELATSSASMREVQPEELLLENVTTHETCNLKPTVFTETPLRLKQVKVSHRTTTQSEKQTKTSSVASGTRTTETCLCVFCL